MFGLCCLPLAPRPSPEKLYTKTKFEISPLLPPIKVGLRIISIMKSLVITIEPLWGYYFFIHIFFFPNRWGAGIVYVANPPCSILIDSDPSLASTPPPPL